MNRLTPATLRRANASRAARIHPDRPPTILFWTLAIAGELGELANELKKAARGDYAPGHPAAEKKIADEIADVVIYCDLYGWCAGIEPAETFGTPEKWANDEDAASSRATLQAAIVLHAHGALSDLVKATGAMLAGVKAQHMVAQRELRGIMAQMHRLTLTMSTTLDEAIVSKFNAVSRARGLPERIRENVAVRVESEAAEASAGWDAVTIHYDDEGWDAVTIIQDDETWDPQGQLDAVIERGLTL